MAQAYRQRARLLLVGQILFRYTPPRFQSLSMINELFSVPGCKIAGCLIREHRETHGGISSCRSLDAQNVCPVLAHGSPEAVENARLATST